MAYIRRPSLVDLEFCSCSGAEWNVFLPCCRAVFTRSSFPFPAMDFAERQDSRQVRWCAGTRRHQCVYMCLHAYVVYIYVVCLYMGVQMSVCVQYVLAYTRFMRCSRFACIPVAHVTAGSSGLICGFPGTPLRLSYPWTSQGP